MMDAGKCTLSDEGFEASRFPGKVWPDMMKFVSDTVFKRFEGMDHGVWCFFTRIG